MSWKHQILYKSSHKCDDQQQYNAMIESTMLSTTERFTGNVPILYGSIVTVNQTNARKPLHQFSETLDGKPKTDFWQLCTSKLMCKAIRAGSMLWSSIPKWFIHTKINKGVKKISLKLYSTTSSGCAVSNS